METPRSNVGARNRASARSGRHRLLDGRTDERDQSAYVDHWQVELHSARFGLYGEKWLTDYVQTEDDGRA
jgi:hypothetical protein